MHHTKVKADIGLCKVITDLTMKHFAVCLPISEHQAFDLVAVSPEQKIFRIQVKFATLRKNGSIEVGYRRNWADKHGVHTKHYSKDEFDYYAIYCPEKELVLYIQNGVKCPKTIRFDKSKNNQEQNIHHAKDFMDIK